jgi:membrane-bound lytic murein transglycosylase MltF
MSDWYDSLRVDQKQFVASLRYSIAPSTATNEYLEEMVRELCNVCDDMESNIEDISNDTDKVMTAFKRNQEKKYTGKEVLNIITKTIGA